LIEYPIRVMAARSGAQLGKGTSGASLLTAGMASKNAKSIIEKLHKHGGAEKFIIEAMNDPSLMKILLTETTTPAQKKAAEKQLDSWFTRNQRKVDAMLLAPSIQNIEEE